jgi:hypothetical protein
MLSVVAVCARCLVLNPPPLPKGIYKTEGAKLAGVFQMMLEKRSILAGLVRLLFVD